MLARPDLTLPLHRHQRAQGAARLIVKHVGDQTRIDRLFQQGCAKIRLPRSCDGTLQAVMINSSGGMTGGDNLQWEIDLAPHTTTTITTQACERIYRATGDVSRSSINLTVEKDAKLSWLPQETILFDESNLHRTINADLAAGAQALFVESLIFGRRAMNEIVQSGALRDSWRIKLEGKLIHAEEMWIEGNIADQLANPFVTNGQAAMSTLLLVSPNADGLLGPTREIIGNDGDASSWNGKLLARLTANTGYDLRKKLIPLIKLLNFAAPLPKVWSI